MKIPHHTVGPSGPAGVPLTQPVLSGRFVSKTNGTLSERVISWTLTVRRKLTQS